MHGNYQRLDAFVQALVRVADRTHCVFLVPRGEAPAGDDVRDHETRLQRRWAPSVSIEVAPTVDAAGPPGRWRAYGRGLVDFHALPVARPVDNAATIAAVAGALATGPDLVFADRLAAMATLMRLAPSRRSVPVYFDLNDVEHVALARRLRWRPDSRLDRLMLLQLPALLRGERRAIRMSTETFVCSEDDRRHLQRWLRVRNVRVVPNSVSIPDVDLGHPTEPLVLFVGSLAYPPNAAAADTLVQHVWPRVRREVPGARLVVVGQQPEYARSYPPADPSVEFPGFVDDLAAVYRRARVVCCPISFGGGTRLKIIDAAAHGKAVVSTPLGAEGLAFMDGREIVLRADMRGLAAECARLLKDPEAAAALGTAARARVIATYARGPIVDALAAALTARLAAGR